MHVQALMMAAVTAGKQTASDNFDSYANNSTLSGQGHWLRLSGTTIDLGILNPTGSAGQFVGASGDPSNVLFWNSGTWSPDQWSQATVVSATSRDVIAAVRCGGGSCYYSLWTTSFGGRLRLFKLISGTLTQLTSVTFTPAAGDVIRCEVAGSGAATRLTLKRNGVTISSGIDPGSTYLSTGNPGIGSGNNALFTGNGGDNWSASDI